MNEELIIKDKGILDYLGAYRLMTAFTKSRRSGIIDEIWFLQHFPVYTLGLAGDRSHFLGGTHIPVVETDRGGQITYHGPGQLVVYLLIDIKRRSIGVKEFVRRIEQSVIDMLNSFNVTAVRRDSAPGVYIEDKKISAIGLRLKKGYSYHGMSINVDMDLSPYDNINSCGYHGLQMTQIRDLGIDKSVAQIRDLLLPHLLSQLNYSDIHIKAG